MSNGTPKRCDTLLRGIVVTMDGTRRVLLDGYVEPGPVAKAINHHVKTGAPTARPIPVARCVIDSNDVSCRR